MKLNYMIVYFSLIRRYVFNVVPRKWITFFETKRLEQTGQLFQYIFDPYS